ncbi:MAG: L,D-transpeptidase [Anaerolineaceae bacterium]|nr:L,D-transpeptidase [Anaerolineaceae bacterium]
MENTTPSASQALQKARDHLRSKNVQETFRWAKIVTEISPELEEGWLIRAACSKPEDSVRCLIKALEINPNSQRARQGMDWAIKRLRKSKQENQTPPPPPAPVLSTTKIAPISKQKSENKNHVWLKLAGIAIIILLVGFGTWLSLPTIKTVFAEQPISQRPIGVIQKLTITPTATATATSTATPTATATATSTSTSTPTATFTPTSTPTFTPTVTPRPTMITNAGVVIPDEVDENTRWIDIDLSDQMLYAYIGENVVNSFLVSTGTWRTPTVIGQFHVWVKYRYTDMRGPGYYLPDVPYTMYFYKGYGIHGTYWHDNFGTPMSHGCVNMRTPEAGWLFDFASVGTLVNVHE